MKMVRTPLKILNSKLVFFLFCLLGACGAESANGLRSVEINTSKSSYSFKAEVADTDALRQKGYMNRSDLTEDSAMLFVWPANTEGSFWMKDTPTSLDIIFVSENNSVNYMAPHAVPFSTDLITPINPYRYVLEVKAGFVEKSGLKLGDKIELR